MTNNQHGQVPEALRLAHIFDNPLPPEWPDMVAAAAELRRQHARIAELEALGGVQPLSLQKATPAVVDQAQAAINLGASGGVQALSAAPNGWESVIDEARSGLQDSEPSAFDNSGYRAFAETVLDAVQEGLSALAASPTPPAEQQAQLGAVYAELGCDEVSRVVDVVVERCISLTQDATGIKVVYDPIILCDALLTELRDFADRTHALRMQAAPKAAPTRTALPEGWTALMATQIPPPMATSNSPT